MNRSPIGDLCVLKDFHAGSWNVSICWGGIREHLQTFVDYGRASEFALEEQERRRMAGEDLVIHFPDDCPCICTPPTR